ncbi:hypothetical protein GCM10009754_45920 [Amycolatopsis minnesotensis]|uniref:Uncharacterized protein n=1 Tax=Amycolatopsis minnesotensis TaxID=337894 RepID=A0ABP5CTX2_9PSEU
MVKVGTDSGGFAPPSLPGAAVDVLRDVRREHRPLLFTIAYEIPGRVTGRVRPAHHDQAKVLSPVWTCC